MVARMELWGCFAAEGQLQRVMGAYDTQVQRCHEEQISVCHLYESSQVPPPDKIPRQSHDPHPYLPLAHNTARTYLLRNPFPWLEKKKIQRRYTARAEQITDSISPADCAIRKSSDWLGFDGEGHSISIPVHLHFIYIGWFGLIHRV